MLFPFEKIFEGLVAYRYIFLLPVAIVEGPIITVIAGFMSSLGYFNFAIVYVIVIIGDILGDTLYYAIGYFGRNQFINRWGHYIGLSLPRILALEKHFEVNSGKTLLVGKLAQLPGGAVLVAAGAARMNYWRFLMINVCITIPKAFILLLIGFYFGQFYAQIYRYFNYAGIITFGLIVLAIIIYFLFFRKKKAEKIE